MQSCSNGFHHVHFYYDVIEKPPSTFRLVPVIKEALEEHRKATASPISSGSTITFIGQNAKVTSSILCGSPFPKNFNAASVLVAPGITQLQVILLGASLTA